LVEPSAYKVVYFQSDLCYNVVTTEELAVKSERKKIMKEINIAKNISELRKQKGITQEQLAVALNISPQAVSKWETNTSQPDTMTLPLIANYFGVSIDYLYYGDDYAYGDIYNKIYDKVAKHPQQSREAYEEAFKIFGYAHQGTSRWNNKKRISDTPLHLSNENGLSLLSGKGYGVILTRDFFENIDCKTVDFAQSILPVLSEKNNLLVCLAIISMSDISFGEMQEKLVFDEKTLRESLDILIESKIVIEKRSKHKSLGLTYEINEIYHTCLCILIATIEMQRYSLKEISCCMGFGDYPVKI